MPEGLEATAPVPDPDVLTVKVAGRANFAMATRPPSIVSVHGLP